MFQFPCLPKHISNWLQVLRPMFRHRHHLIFCWLLVCQAVYQEKATIKGLARLAPRPMAAWHFRRLLAATYWNGRLLWWWFVDHAMVMLPPPPEDGVCDVVVESTVKGKTGQKHPLAKKGRLHEYAPDIFGLHLVVVRHHWGSSRIPVDFAMVRRQDHPRYHSENALFRGMLVRFRRPRWAEMVVVVADAAFASQANRRLIQRRGYFFVMALARTWCVDNRHARKELVPCAEAPRSPGLGALGCAWPPPDLLDLYHMGAPATYGSCHHDLEPATAQRWAETDQHSGDPSARYESPAGRGCVSKAVVCGAPHEKIARSLGLGSASSHQRSATGRALTRSGLINTLDASPKPINTGLEQWPIYL